MQPNNNTINNSVGATTPVSTPVSGSVATPEKPAAKESSNEDVVFNDKPKKSHGMTIGMILLALLAAGGIGFGVWAMMDGNQQKEALNTQISTLKKQISDLQDKASNGSGGESGGSESGNGTSENESETSTTVNAAGYIYVGEWGLKIKIPDGLTSVSYSLNQRAGYSSLDIWGVDCSDSKCQYFPDYADTSKNHSGMGSIARYEKGKTFDEGSAPTLVFSDESYDYYQYHPQAVYTSEGDEIEWEASSVEMISNMLSNSENYSKI